TQAIAPLEPNSLAAPGVAQFRGPRREISGKVERGSLFVPGAGVECALDKKTGSPEGPRCRVVARVPRVELNQAQAFPARPLGKDFGKDGREPGLLVRFGAADHAVFDAVGVGEAGKVPFVRRGVRAQQKGGCRARPLVGVHADFAASRYAVSDDEI